MEIVLRKIKLTDVDKITGLTEQLGYTIPQEQMRQNIAAVLHHSDCDAFVATHEEELVGWIGLAYRIQLESVPVTEINGLVVDERYRGKGVGKKLIEKAKEWSTEKGCTCLRLRANVKRDEAHKFYRALGFAEMKQQKVFEMAL